MKTNTNTPTIVVVLSLLCAFFFDIKAINSIIQADVVFDVENSGIMARLYLITCAGIMLCGIILHLRKHIRINVVPLAIVTVLSIFYFATYCFLPPPYTPVTYFVVLTLMAFIIPFISAVDTRLFLKSMMLFATPALFRQQQIFHFVADYSDSISMGISYAFLPPVISAIIYLFVYLKKEKLWQQVISLTGISINFLFAFYLISYGSRGPVLSIVLLIVFLLSFSTRSSGGIIIIKRKALWLIPLMVFAIVLFIPLLSFFQGILSEHGVTLYFVDKFLSMNEAGDMSNGRYALYRRTIMEIIDSPIWGYGMDQFANNHPGKGVYPHNFILQILYDGGLLLFVFLLVPFAKGWKSFVKRCTFDEYSMFSLLLFASVPSGLLSGDLWQNSIFWTLFGFLLASSFVHKSVSKA